MCMWIFTIFLLWSHWRTPPQDQLRALKHTKSQSPGRWAEVFPSLSGPRVLPRVLWGGTVREVLSDQLLRHIPIVIFLIPSEFGLCSANVKELFWLQLGELGEKQGQICVLERALVTVTVLRKNQRWSEIAYWIQVPLPPSTLWHRHCISWAPSPFGFRPLEGAGRSLVGRVWGKSQGIFSPCISASISYRGCILHFSVGKSLHPFHSCWVSALVTQPLTILIPTLEG